MKEPIGMTSEVWLIQRWKHHSLIPGTQRVESGEGDPVCGNGVRG